MSPGSDGVGRDGTVTDEWRPAEPSSDSVVQDLHADITRWLTARHIVTPVDELIGFQVGDKTGDAVGVMTDHRFDYGPVRDESGRILGRVRRTACEEHLSRSIADVYEPLSDTMLLGGDTSIGAAIEALRNDPWLFVVSGPKVVGLVTPDDLDRQAARVYLYLLISDFELRLAQLVRSTFPDQELAVSLLDCDAKNRVCRRYKDAIDGDLDVDLVVGMDLRDLITIGGQTREVSAAFRLRPTDWTDATDHIYALRTSIAHSTKPILLNDFELEDLADVEARLRQLLRLL